MEKIVGGMLGGMKFPMGTGREMRGGAGAAVEIGIDEGT